MKEGRIKIEVGVLLAERIEFEFLSSGKGAQEVSIRDGRILYEGELHDELYFRGEENAEGFSNPSFTLKDVVIGIDFHWERKVDQSFAGDLKFILEDGKIRAVNIVWIEDYLLSVISSEMKSSARKEYLKAHAVISRSWVLAQIEKVHPHRNFDVCADDHCQRYQGVSMAVGQTVREAILETAGIVLTYRGELCDTRFSKCCGGRTEIFSTCWEDKDYPYLQSVEDPYCNTSDTDTLSRVLNDYDLETKDFYEWTVEFKRSELSSLVRRKTGVDFGEILDLIPLERGESGRIKSLRIVGTRAEKVIGKELAIRRALSESHLKSSWFDLEWEGDLLRLKGRGWGHGVGLCQIGAAVMAGEGYDHRRILSYYYPGSELKEYEKY